MSVATQNFRTMH